MKNLLFASVTLLMFGLITTQTSCKKENEEELFPCDISDATYSVEVDNVFSNNCYQCHGNGAQLGGVILDVHSEAVKYANNGRLLCSIKHECNPMPQGGPKMSACEIETIEEWVDAGAPNN